MTFESVKILVYKNLRKSFLAMVRIVAKTNATTNPIHVHIWNQFNGLNNIFNPEILQNPEILVQEK